MQDGCGKKYLLKKLCGNVSSLKQEGESVDTVLEGRLKVIQKEKGYRFSIDAYLLAHFVHVDKDDHVMDMGTGSAVIAMIIANRWPQVKVVGVDIQPEMVDMAKRSIALNALENRIEVRQGDIKTIKTLFGSRMFDAVVLNPPYRKLNSGRLNPDHQKSVARHEIHGSLADFLSAAEYILKAAGHFFTIYPASRIVELICRMRQMCIEPKRIRVVYSHDRSCGEFVLVEGIKGGKEEMKVLPPLFIYSEDGTYTADMARLFKELSGFP
jgi:tRNA1Val (adenine37-N6)-methyltransferase